MTNVLTMTAVMIFVAQSSFADMLVAARPIRARSILTIMDVELAKGDPAGGFSSAADIVGLESRVALFPGRPIRRDQVGQPAIIERNSIITLIFRRGGLTISTEGRALARGAGGDVIQVMNLTSKATLFGRVLDAGTIEVGQ